MVEPIKLSQKDADIYRAIFEKQGRGPIAFVAIVPDENLPGIGGSLGIAVANEPGYNPIPLAHARYATFADAELHAEEMTAMIGVDSADGYAIIFSTMGGKPFTGEW